MTCSPECAGEAVCAPENRERLESTRREELIRAAADGFTEDELGNAKEGSLEARTLGRASDGVLAGRAPIGSSIACSR